MRWLSRFPVDGFLLTIIAAAVAASLFPADGVWAQLLDWLTAAAIAALFFLYGARLSPRETWTGLKHWRLHATILSFTYLVFPLIGLAVVAATDGWLDPGLQAGLLYLTLVPSTVQSSIAFTSIARGNVAGAVVSASASNILGVVLTPLLVWLLMTHTGEVSFTADTIVEILLQLFVPFLLGQLSRPWTSGFVAAHPQLRFVDRASIVLVVFSAFSAGMREGMWQQTTWGDLGLLLVITLLILAFVLWATRWIARRLGFDRGDVIAVQFCGTKKSLASGLPMAGVLFAGQPIGLLLLPLMLFHQVQLMACSSIAARYAREPVAA